MSDGNPHRSPLPQNQFLSGVRAGEARMRQRALRAFRQWLRENNPHITPEEADNAEQAFRRMMYLK